MLSIAIVMYTDIKQLPKSSIFLSWEKALIHFTHKSIRNVLNVLRLTAVKFVSRVKTLG